MTNPTAQPTVREVLRTSVANLLTAVTGIQAECPGAFDTAPKDVAGLGEVKVRSGNESKVSIAKSGVGTTTTSTVDLLARCSAATAEAAQAALDNLMRLVEAAIFAAPSLIKDVQQVAQVRSEFRVEEEGEVYWAACGMAIDFEVYEEWDPVLITPDNFPALEGIDLYLDTVKPFDAQSTYTSSFPGSYPVPPAPRETGPDGRVEIRAPINTA